MNLFCSVYYLLPYDVALRAPSYFPFDRRICQVTGRAAKERAQSAPSLGAVGRQSHVERRLRRRGRRRWKRAKNGRRKDEQRWDEMNRSVTGC